MSYSYTINIVPLLTIPLFVIGYLFRAIQIYDKSFKEAIKEKEMWLTILLFATFTNETASRYIISSLLIFLWIRIILFGNSKVHTK